MVAKRKEYKLNGRRQDFVLWSVLCWALNEILFHISNLFSNLFSVILIKDSVASPLGGLVARCPAGDWDPRLLSLAKLYVT